MAVFTTAGSMRDDAYRPILRPRRGELAALSHLAAGDAARVMPILELEPGPGIIPLIRQLPPRTGAIAVDFGGLPEPSDPLEALARLGEVRSFAATADWTAAHPYDPAELDAPVPRHVSLHRRLDRARVPDEPRLSAGRARAGLPGLQACPCACAALVAHGSGKLTFLPVLR